MQERSLESLIDLFEHQRLPQSEWTHRAHLRVALYYLRRLEPDMALELIRELIQQLNLVHQVLTTPERGYHETRTRVWLAILLHGIESGKTDEMLLSEYSGVDVVTEAVDLVSHRESCSLLSARNRSIVGNIPDMPQNCPISCEQNALRLTRSD